LSGSEDGSSEGSEEGCDDDELSAMHEMYGDCWGSEFYE
jgi:hypothetical protein